MITANRLTNLAGIESVRRLNRMDGAPARIVVIDDDAEMRAMLEQMLESAGYSVALAQDGHDGINQCSMATPSLVITDLFMPNKEGIETIIQLRRDFPTVSVIAMSGKTGAEPLFFAARRLGAVRTLSKPFQPRELLALVEQVLSDADAPPSSQVRLEAVSKSKCANRRNRNPRHSAKVKDSRGQQPHRLPYRL